MKELYCVIVYILFASQTVFGVELSFDAVREKIIEAERVAATGGGVWLTAKEEKANSILMNAKRQEMADGLKNPDMYPPGMHFFQAKPRIRQSEVFRIIQKMPKGAFLHGHNSGIVSSKWIISNLTSLYNLHMCHDERGVLVFTYDEESSRCKGEVKNICAERLNAEDRRQFERQLEKHINMYTMHPEASVSQSQKIWRRFENIFDTVDSFYKYMPTFRAYHKRMLEEFCEDNIIYAEIRASLSPLYGDNNLTYNSLEVANELERIVESFKERHSDFVGLKVIYAKRNKATVDEMSERIEKFKHLHAAKPNFIIGFDLIGQEDVGDPLHKFIAELSELPNTAHFFFHAGETKWFGRTDWNLMDAILLNTKRIGHGYALMKHPQLWATVKKRNIAIEVNPISNQVLGLVWDLRNHPAAFYIAENFPVIISADDPGAWNSKGLSYDFYYAFMAFAPAEADLRVLKQFALNSLNAAKPNFIIGFDLIGQEDVGDPLHKFIAELSELPNTAHFFFHAGETKWFGRTDWNLMDAILLNTKRIGHGYALMKHPQLWATVKKRNIAIEVNPISNQVLGLVWDLRNHPAAFYIAENFPVIISADDPGAWNSKGLSYDFYYAFMAFAPAEADLRVLKQFALNSLKYSILTAEERRQVNKVFQRKWDEFINNVIGLKF